MRLFKILILALATLPGVSFARITDGKYTYKVEKNLITVKIDKGFHINEKAPMSFKFYICDDKKTACESHEIKPNLKND